MHPLFSGLCNQPARVPTVHAQLQNKAKNRWYVPDPNKAGDLEKVREKSLLKEFEAYKTEKKKLKLFNIL